MSARAEALNPKPPAVLPTTIKCAADSTGCTDLRNVAFRVVLISCTFRASSSQSTERRVVIVQGAPQRMSAAEAGSILGRTSKVCDTQFQVPTSTVVTLPENPEQCSTHRYLICFFPPPVKLQTDLEQPAGTIDCNASSYGAAAWFHCL